MYAEENVSRKKRTWKRRLTRFSVPLRRLYGRMDTLTKARKSGKVAPDFGKGDPFLEFFGERE